MASIINADTSDGLKISSDTSGIIELQSGGVTKMTVNSSGVSNSGKILQVLQTIKKDTFSTTSNSYVPITGLNVSITPSATSSKILVMANVSASGSAVNIPAHVTIRRGTTDILLGDPSGSRTRTAGTHCSVYGTERQLVPMSMSALDSPNTTSATTYHVNVLVAGSYTAYVNMTPFDYDNTGYGRACSQITVMEIAG